MTTLTDTQVITASGGLVELGYANLTANATITAAVASPALVTGLSTTVVCDGGPVMVEFFTPSLRPPATAGQEIAVNLFVDGSSYGSIANAYNPASNNDNKPAHGCYRLTPTAGSHTFDIRAGVTSGATGYINSGNNSGGAAAFIRVSKIVQATQWPAVTTGTIICTSSTRPASPFEGQTIYETDTKRELRWNGTAWVSPDVAFRPPSCGLYLNANATYSNNTNISWYGSLWDTDSMWASSPNPTRITISKAGIYSVSFNGRLDGSSGFNVVGAAIRKNGGDVASSYSALYSGATITRFSVPAILSLAANDYIEGRISVDGGGTLTIYGSSTFGIDQTRLQVAYLGQA